MKTMTKESKDTIATISAVAMLIFGATITAIGFFVDPLGEIHQSVLYVLGQCLIYSGSIFGITVYTRRRLDDMEKMIRDKESEEEKDGTTA